MGHHVVLSIVGVDGVPDSGYYRSKFAQEDLIRNGSVPYSIVRATQFFEFIGGIADAATLHDYVVRLPPVLVQPIAVNDVAVGIARIAVRPPSGRTDRTLQGPEEFRLDDLVRRSARG